MKKVKLDDVISLAGFAIFPTIVVVILSFCFLILPFGNIGLVQTMIVLPAGFILCPVLMLRKVKLPALGELGIKRLTVLDSIICALAVTVVIFYIGLSYGFDSLRVLAIETIIIACCEEFWARGVLFYVLEKMELNAVAVIVISSLIFVFVTHMNRAPLENLLYRLPGAILMGVIYKKTGKLAYSITFHYCYNLLGSF